MSTSSAISTSQLRQNFHTDAEAAINAQINMELTASYVYHSMAMYFDRDDVALPGFHKFFKHQSDEERQHAEMFMSYQNKRGGRIMFRDVAKPVRDTWGQSPVEAVQAALALEKRVNESLLAMHALAADHGDAHLTNFLEEHFLTEQVTSIRELSEMSTRLRRAGVGLGEYLFDKELLEQQSSSS